MMNTSTVHVAGLEQLQRALLELPDAVARKALRRAVAKAAQVIKQQAKALAPRYVGPSPRSKGPLGQTQPPPGTLQRQMKVAFRPRESGLHRAKYVVGVLHGKRQRSVSVRKGGRSATVNRDAYYWRFVEFGTAHMAARPFLRPAFAQKKSEAVGTIREVLAEQISAEAARLR